MDREQLLVTEVSYTHPLLSLHWEELPQLPWGMYNAQSVWHNGCLFVGGGIVAGMGWREREEATLYVYSHQQWREIDTPTFWYTLVIFNRKPTIVGGCEYTSHVTTNKVWQLQSSHGEDGGEEWKDDAIPPMATKRWGASAVAHHNSLLVAGGRDDGWNALAIVEVFSSQLQQWLSTTSLPRPCCYMSSTVVGSHLVFAGGEEQHRECYRCSLEDILSSSLQWERLADLPLSETSITTHNGVLLAIGGYDGSSLRSAMFVFSVSTQRWRHFFDLPLPLFRTTTPTGNIIAIGGISDSGYSSRAFKLYLQDDAAALGLSNIILRGVQNGLLALVERALTAVNEHFHSSQPVDGSLLLDFLAHNSSHNVSSIEQSCSPLMIACANGDTKMVNVLLENGASPSYKNKDDVTAVHVGCSKDNLKLVQRLVASDGGLTHQATTNLLQMIDKEGQTVFHYSSQFGTETLKWLLKNKALCANTLNKRTNTGLTPLLTACHHGNEAAVKVLVTHDMDTAVYDVNKQGALHLAAQHDSESLVKLLLEKGCPIDAQDSEGNTALHIAYKKSSISVINFLTWTQLDNASGPRITLAQIKNNAGRYPTDVEPDDMIPPEILKKGAKAVDLYFKALKKGKKRIPRCNFPILGEGRVGKTSLYRHLVDKPFNPKQKSTCGIENTTVDTMVDTRNIGAEDWAEKDESTVKQHADQQLVDGVVGTLLTDLLGPTPTDTESKQILEEELSKLEPKIQQILSAKKELHTHDQRTQQEHQAQAQPTHPKQQPQPSGWKNKLFQIFRKEQPRPTQAPAQPTAQLEEKPVTVSQAAPGKTNKDSSTLEEKAVPKSLALEKPNNDSSTQVETQESVTSLSTDSEEESDSESTPPIRAAPKVSNRQVKLFNQALVAAATSKERKENVLELILNVLDFAGQEEYHPMQHCFLTRRAIYLVVFNIRHAILYLEYITQRSNKKVANPFDELRYWLHSIHAHSLPAVTDKKEEKPLKNVCLVGTHRGRLNRRKQGELKEINDFLIQKELCSDDRCLEHLHFIGPDGDTIFLAVENSIKDREASGANALRKEINVMAENLPFLNEDHPVIWFRFDSELSQLKEESRKQSVSSLIIKVDRVLEIATQSGITNPDEQNLALEFYHETGKIVCLKFLPSLFISKEEHDELKELVLLDPKWLIHVMKNVMEFNFRSPIKGAAINKLIETGVATSDLLKEAWSDYLQEPKEQSLNFRQMCLILQAEALIHPIRIIPKSALEQSPSRSDSTLEAQPSSTLPPTSEAATTDENVEYLIPGKLPAANIVKKPDRGITFYFDFQRFLPREIFHRLVCLLLAITQKKKSFDKRVLSQNMCQFQNIDGCNWRIQLDGERHRLMITVFPSETDPRSPTHHITTMHTEYLQEICKKSDLQGLRYVGGPLLDPCAQCGQTGVIRYVSYYVGDELESKSECPTEDCRKGYDIHQLLTNQDKLADTSNAGVATSNTQHLLVEKDWAKICCYLIKLDEPQIQLLGGILGLNVYKLEKMKNLPNDMVRAWLRREDDVKKECGPKLTWSTLVKALCEIGQTGVADEIHKDKCT